MLRDFIGSLLRTAGLALYRRRSQPRGLDLVVDLKRHWQGRAPQLILDVGANIGQTARFYARNFPTAAIHAFEPVGSTYQRMVRNLTRGARITPHRLALGDRDGTARIEAVPESGSNRLLADGTPSTRPVETVPLRRLDTFCAEQRLGAIDLLKTDCEGHDLDVLKGAGNLLVAGAVDCIYCEVNFRRDGQHGDFFAITEYLRSVGYHFYALYDYSGWQYDVASEGFASALYLRGPRPAPERPATLSR